jgi:curved DNA-binding protein CbpA
MTSQHSSNKRIFPRYRLNVETDVIVSGEMIKARLADFSVGGVGLITKEVPFTNSEHVDIKINRIDVDSPGKIIWSEDIVSGKRLGIQKTGSMRGSLSKYRLSDFLIGLQRLVKTGILHVGVNSTMKKIYLKSGDVIFSASDEDRERMGDMLLEIGKITPEQFRKSSEVMEKSSKRLGAVLVELGYLSPKELIWAVQYQVEKIIHNLFSLKEGNVVFNEEPLPVKELIILKLSTGNLIYRGIKSIDSSEISDNNLPSRDSVLYFSSAPMTLFQEITLDQEDRNILSLINGTRTIEDIISMSPLDEKETLKTLYALYSTQLIEVIEKSIVTPDVAQEEILEQPSHETDSATVEKIENLYREYKKLGHYGILNISRHSSASEIKRAYYRMAKEFHPDRHLHFQSDELKGKLNTIFAYINEAYNVLTSSKKADSSISSQPPESADDKAHTARMKFVEGKRFLTSKQYEQALTLFGQAVYFDSSIAEYHFFYGVSLLNSRKIKDSEKSIRKAIELDPYNSDYIAELGNIYLRLGFTTRAKNTFEKALKYNPFNDSAKAGLKTLDIKV